MKRSVILVLIWMLLCGLETVGYGQQTFRSTGTSVIGYLEYLPGDYSTNSDKYPVVIFLHGIGERGANTTDLALLRQSVQKVTALGPPAHVESGKQFPFILISPQLKNNYSSWPSWYVLEVIDDIKTRLRIDEKRIYLTGLSLGGGGAWWAAQDYPELFAALAPVCGGMNSPSKACAIAGENLPVWAFHGDKDSIVPLSRSIQMVNAINACSPAPEPQAKMTVYPGVAHDAWKNAYRTDHSLHQPNVYEWMLSWRNTINQGNALPSANAGADRTVSGTQAVIEGSASDADGTISAYTWKQLSGPSGVTLKNANTRTLSASNLETGDYVFVLRVTDNAGGTDSDYVGVHVSPVNQPPVVDAGEDKLILLPNNAATLQGGAHDGDGEIVSWAWVQRAGPRCTMKDTTAAVLRISDLVSGSYTFELSATDDAGVTSSDEVSVYVNVPPVADAGPDSSVAATAVEVVLEGKGSDADGQIEDYTWTKYSGPEVMLKDAGTPSLKVTDLREGTYVFALTVADDFNASATDHVTLTVRKEMLTTDFPRPWEGELQRAGLPVPKPDKSPAQNSRHVLDKFTAFDLEDCMVTVFDKAGERIFSGTWSPGSYRETFTTSGLYLYHIIRGGELIGAGKIYIGN